MARKEYGSARQGERTDLTLPQCSKVWTQAKTAEKLNISQQAVAKSIQIARAVEILLLEYEQGVKGLYTEVMLSSYQVIFIALPICTLTLCIPDDLIV